MKVYMAKAYDRVEWAFLESIMLRMGFDVKWVQLIITFISFVRYRILHNGRELGPILPQRGLRQGNHLSPYLFIICAEALTSLIRTQENDGLVHGCRIAPGGPPISHLFFTDDYFLYFRANVSETKVIKQILHDYGAALGQRINFQKSSISFSRNVDLEVREAICSELWVQGTVDHGHYLGLPSMIGCSKKQVMSLKIIFLIHFSCLILVSLDLF